MIKEEFVYNLMPAFTDLQKNYVMHLVFFSGNLSGSDLSVSDED